MAMADQVLRAAVLIVSEFERSGEGCSARLRQVALGVSKALLGGGQPSLRQLLIFIIFHIVSVLRLFGRCRVSGHRARPERLSFAFNLQQPRLKLFSAS